MINTKKSDYLFLEQLLTRLFERKIHTNGFFYNNSTYLRIVGKRQDEMCEFVRSW